MQPRLEHGLLLEQIVLCALPVRVIRGLEEHRELALDAALTVALREIEQPDQIDDQRRSEDRILAQKVDLELHALAEEPDEVDRIPRFLRVTARLVVIDVNLVVADRIAEDVV